MATPAATYAATPATTLPTGARGALIVVEYWWIWYKRHWRASAVSSVLQPLLMLLAFGLAFGSLVEPSETTGNVDYLVFLAPGLLAMTAVQIAAAESTYPVHACFKWHRAYFAMTAGPLGPVQLVFGQLGWIVLRMFFSCAVYLAVIALFGGTRGLGSVAALVFATLCGLAVAAPLLAFTASVNDEGSKFGVVLRFVILPMTLFAGTFFPVSQLPAAVRPLAWISPLWHGTELARGATLGTLRPLAATGHLAYLLGLAAIGVAIAMWRYRVRLYV
jgi:lipooligosaccharide transport system permease protein